MAQVKLKAVGLLTAGFLALLFLHNVPIGLGNVTTVGTSNPEAAAQTIDESSAIARLSRQASFESQVEYANVRSVFGGSSDTRLYVVAGQATYMKN